jgi:hypothetical protein
MIKIKREQLIKYLRTNASHFSDNSSDSKEVQVSFIIVLPDIIEIEE